jgi:hypothetical protein
MHACHQFVAAVEQGLPLARTMQWHFSPARSLSSGRRYSHDDHCFNLCTASLGTLSVRLSRALLVQSNRFVVPRADGEGNIMLSKFSSIRKGYVLWCQIGACSLSAWPGPICTGHREVSSSSRTSFACCKTSLSARSSPSPSITALVEAQEVWHSELGPIDGVSSAIVRGLLVMPKITAPLRQQTVLHNHPGVVQE